MRCPSCGSDNEEAAEVCFVCRAVLAAITQGSVIAGRYEIVQQLGRGGMGVVYKARDRILDELVALKLLRAQAAENSDLARRFRTEIKLARKITHPNVCRIHDYGEEGALRYISMELVEGTDLKRLIRDQGPFPPADAFALAAQIGQGLQAIHRVGVVHRDLKTPNIMLDVHGTIRLMDFGIAKNFTADTASQVTSTGLIVGTPEYMSPEQARGERIDARSDIYAFGVVVYELFTGDVPFRGDTPLATLLKHIEQPPPLDGPAAAKIPRALVPVLRQALSKDAGGRFANADLVTEAIQAARAGSALPVTTPARRVDFPTRTASSPPPTPIIGTPRPAAGAVALAPVPQFDTATEVTPTPVPAPTVRRPRREPVTGRPSGPAPPATRAPGGARTLAVVAAVVVGVIAVSAGLVVLRGRSAPDAAPVPQAPASVAATTAAPPVLGRGELVQLSAPNVGDVERPTGSSVRLRWEAVAGAAAYHVMVDRDAGFGRPVLDQRGVTTTHVGTRDLPPGAYYWRVAAADDRGTDGPFSGAVRFVVSGSEVTTATHLAVSERRAPAPPAPAPTPLPMLEMRPAPAAVSPVPSRAVDTAGPGEATAAPAATGGAHGGGMGSTPTAPAAPAKEPVPVPATTAAASGAAPTAPADGLLKLGVRPYAEVYIDGRPMGSTPMRAVRLAAGTYVVRLSHPNYQPLMRRVTIRSGETRTLEIDLTLDGVRK